MSLAPTRAMTRGVVFVHSTPAALCPHITWALEAVLGDRIALEWSAQPALPNHHRSEFAWAGAPGTGERLTAALKGIGGLRFEVTEEPSPGLTGSRWSHTPSLGTHHMWMAPNGDIVVNEEPLKELLALAQGSNEAVAHMLEEILGTAHDAELEVFRYAGDGAPVRWLHKVG